MQHFKDFIIRLHTFDIQRKQRNTISGGIQTIVPGTSYYDLSNENPYLSSDFRNRLTELTELAVTDLLMLSDEQIRNHVQRLEQIKGRFQDFWKKYYGSRAPFSQNDRILLFSNLQLQENFIVLGLSSEDTAIQITDQFLDDLCDSVQAKEEAIKKLEQTVQRVTVSEEKEDIKWATKYESGKGAPSFKSPEIIEAFYDILKPYFLNEDREQLANLLQTNSTETGLLLFNGFGNQLADAFKQLLDSNLVVGCNQGELENWILNHFLYRDKGKPKKFTEKYLNNIISSTTKQCQSPILDVKKKDDGQFGIFPSQRNKRNHKK
ncbi:hypothetical protein [Pedobacter sp. JCM 36344]|uniref:hypothetical protein n=1 Tax=Pedobacter sp. JCM 36344 TaxID=3374280 RepID=UPI003979B9E7